jgi:tRNA(Arg) A34 adenosine deaminase TadA
MSAPKPNEREIDYRDQAALMSEAIRQARSGIEAGQAPFGCAIGAPDGTLIASQYDTVWGTTDVTAHAEVNALRRAGQVTGSVTLEGCAVATTCEPCPMCMAALHWSRVAVVYCGASIEDAVRAGFNELSLSAAGLLEHGSSPVRLVTGVMADECSELFQRWSSRTDPRAY